MATDAISPAKTKIAPSNGKSPLDFSKSRGYNCFMGTWVHRITWSDDEWQECATCGLQPLKMKSGRPRCRVANQQYKRGKAGITKLAGRKLREEVGYCEICGATENLVVDHDHETDEVRGVLCSPCNVALGYMQDSPSRLRSAASYLER